VAEVAVKRALIKPILFAVLEAEGRLRRIVPMVIEVAIVFFLERPY